jgi:hypothetical protein
MAWLVQEAAEVLDSRIEDEDLDGLAEAVEDAGMSPIGVRIGFKASRTSE